MSYQQQGNSCGAWCAAHRLAIGNNRLLATDHAFNARALSIYARARFNPADANPAWPVPLRAMYTQWCTQGYSDPWRIVSYLRWSGIQAEIRMEGGAMVASGHIGQMRLILEGIGTRGVQPPQRGTLANIGSGRYAIGVFQEPAGLHYLLLHNQGGQFRVYDPRSHQLNWRRLPAAPGYLSPITTTVMTPSVGQQSYTFLGVFIAC